MLGEVVVELGGESVVVTVGGLSGWGGRELRREGGTVGVGEGWDWVRRDDDNVDDAEG